MNDETYTPCTKCGRPMAYCKGQCCGKTKGCHCQEYGPKVCGAIRPGEPKCPYQAVIPSLTVESVSNLKDLADCFVHVSDINTTFYIDDKHRIMTTWAGPVEYNNYDLEANSLGLRSQFLIDHANEYAAYYNKTGEYQKFNFSENTSRPTAFTMQYDASDVSAMPGWQDVGLKEKIGETYGTPVEFYKTTYAYYGTNAQHPVTFLNEETGNIVTPAELYSLLADGEDVTINHVPIVRGGGEWGNSTAYIDGVHLTKVTEPAPPYDSTSFCGSVYTTVSVPRGDDWETVQTQLGFSIEGWAEDGSLEYGRMTVRGVERG